jgi:hypothetical protein
LEKGAKLREAGEPSLSIKAIRRALFTKTGQDSSSSHAHIHHLFLFLKNITSPFQESERLISIPTYVKEEKVKE